MSDFIGLEVTGVKELQSMLNKFPTEIQDAVVPDLSEYVVNTLRAYPTQRYVSRAAAYGQVSTDGAPPGYFSMKQFRYVMMMIHKGGISIPYKRTQNLAKNWKVIGNDRNAIVANEAPYAQYVQGDDTQSRHEAGVGWQTMSATIKAHNNTLMKRATRAANRAAKKLGFNISGNY